MEEWRDVPGWAGFYQVSNAGRVRSIDRVNEVINRFGNPEMRRQRGQLLKAGGGKNGYKVVCFTRPGGERLCAYVHRLVAAAFLGPCPDGKEVCHKDGVKVNCALENLRYGTRSGNALDRYIHGTMNPARGERHYFAKLDADKVRWARSNHGKLTLREMAERLGVQHGTVDSAIKRKTWRHVD